MGLFVQLLAGLLGLVGLRIDGRGAREGVRGVRTARTPKEARALLGLIGRRLELEVEPAPMQVRLTGPRDGAQLDVTVRFERVDERMHFHVTADVVAPAPLATPFVAAPPELAPAGAWSLGDPRFDKVFRIAGEEVPLVLALAPSVREYMLGVAGQLEVEGARLRFEATRAATFLPALLDNLTALVNLLGATPALAPDSLAARIGPEPIPQVRLRCLSALIRTFPADRRTIAACQQAVDDPLPTVRLKAAQHLGPAGLPTLRALAVDPDLEAGLRLAAARRLDVGDAWAVQALIRQLDADGERPLTAARLLGRLGGPPAVPALTAVSRDTRRDRRTREAAQQAVARIQDRHPAAARGHLSLVEDEVGGLSLPGGAGELSLGDE